MTNHLFPFKYQILASEDDEARNLHSRLRSATPFTKQLIKLSSEMRNECFQTAEITDKKAREIINEVPTWKQLNTTPEVRYCDKSNSFYIKKEYKCLPKSLFNAKWRDNNAWNTQAKSTQVLCVLDSETELARAISQPAMNGYIASRWGILLQAI